MGGWESALEGMGVRPDFWSGKKVFLTGHTGFKGSWLSLWLQQIGASVTGYSLAPPTSPSLFVQGHVADGMESIIGDIRDLPALSQAMLAAEPEIVIHMAAQPLVRRSYIDPVETYSTNVMGTVNVLESVRKTSSVKAVINVTTDKCYENNEWAWGYRENEPMGGHDPYSNSKGCSELVSAAYRSSFFNSDRGGHVPVGLATARAGNVIGGGDWAQDRLIPDILAAFQKDMPVKIRSPSAIRPWQHVLEPLCGYLTLAENLHADAREFGEAWNFGPHDTDARSVEWIVRELAQMWSGTARFEIDAGEHPHEATYLKLDISKAMHRLHWKPAMQLREALGLVVEWTREMDAGADMRRVTIAQIQAYHARLMSNTTNNHS